MALPGLLIEYLVVGSMALLWALPLTGVGITDQMAFSKAAALAPSIYVLGMFVDFIAFVVLSQLPTRRFSVKSLARCWLASRRPDIQVSDSNVFKEGPGRSSRGTIWLHQNAPDLVKEIRERSSRDRVARGAFINILIMWAVSLTTPVLLFDGLGNVQWAVLAVFAFFVWVFLEANSYGFELRAGEMLSKEDTNK